MAYVMSFLFQFAGASDAPYYFAYSFPYTYTDLQRYLYRCVGGMETMGTRRPLRRNAWQDVLDALVLLYNQRNVFSFVCLKIRLLIVARCAKSTEHFSPPARHLNSLADYPPWCEFP